MSVLIVFGPIGIYIAAGVAAIVVAVAKVVGNVLLFSIQKRQYENE